MSSCTTIELVWHGQMTNHDTLECNYHQRAENERRIGQHVPIISHRDNPILGAQPPRPSTSNMRYVEVEGSVLLEGKMPRMSNLVEVISLSNASSYENPQSLMHVEVKRGHA